MEILWTHVCLRFFTRVDRVLRRSLGVSETAQTDTTVKPAPPVNPVVEEEEAPPAQPKAETQAPFFELPPHLKDKIEVTMEEVDDDNNPINPSHDEL